MTWQLDQAEDNFSDLIDSAQNDGPQVVTDGGDEVVVVVSAEEYRRLQKKKSTLFGALQACPEPQALQNLERITEVPGKPLKLS